MTVPQLLKSENSTLSNSRAHEPEAVQGHEVIFYLLHDRIFLYPSWELF